MESNINNIYRNLQKKAKRTRYEQEKAFMETLRGVGCTVGDYVGDGQGELESTSETVDTGPVDVDPVDDHQHSEEDEDEDEYVDASGTDDSRSCSTVKRQGSAFTVTISQTLQPLLLYLYTNLPSPVLCAHPKISLLLVSILKINK